MLGLPTDIIRCVADHVSLHDLCTLARLNKDLCEIFTPMIYSAVRLDNRKSTEVFCNSIINGRPELRSHPRLILINPRKMLVKVLATVAQLIKQALLLTENLVDLTLSMPSKAIKIIFRDAQYRFSLQRLCCPLITHAKFTRFLLEQSGIQDLVILRDVRGTINVGASFRNPSANLLPNLRSISANYDSLQAMIPERPISNVSTGRSILDVPHFQSFGALLARSSARVVSLSVCISCSSFLLAAVVNHLFESLEENHVVPRSLCVTIVFPAHTPSNKQSLFPHIQDCLQSMKLSSLSGLENLEIAERECPCPLAEEFCHIVEDLSLFAHWKEACSTLKCVSIFGISLYG